MRTLDQTNGYKTQANAIKAASEVCNLEEIRWVMTVNEEGRFTVTVGMDNFHLVHTGKIAVFN